MAFAPLSRFHFEVITARTGSDPCEAAGGYNLHFRFAGNRLDSLCRDHDRRRRIRRDDEIKDELAAFTLPAADNLATRMFVTRAHPIERLTIRIAGDAWHVGL